MKFKDMKLRHKIGVGVVTGAAVVGMAGGAFAYFTATGAGNGSASVGTAANNIAVEGTSTPALYPGESTTMTFTAYNYAKFNQAISKIALTGVVACSQTLTAPTTDSWANATTAPTCTEPGTGPAHDALVVNDTACQNGLAGSDATADWFSMPDVTSFTHASAAQGDLAPAANDGTPSSVVLTPTGTITMNDLNQNQDACKNLHLSFQFTTS